MIPSDPPQPSVNDRVHNDMTAAIALEQDAELMLRVRDGDSASFGLLLDRHRGPVIHFVYRMVLNQAIAEELAQEVFLRVYRSRARYEPTAKFTTWLFRIATHLTLNWIRDGRNERSQESLDNDPEEGISHQVVDRHPTIEQTMVGKVRVEEIRKAIEMLPAKQRAAVIMHKYEEMEYSQISNVLNCSESAVKSLLFRAYETLRKRLAHIWKRAWIAAWLRMRKDRCGTISTRWRLFRSPRISIANCTPGSSSTKTATGGGSSGIRGLCSRSHSDLQCRSQRSA
jgi:RNA polymerase sigma-70 factor (ECF subfamily)